MNHSTAATPKKTRMKLNWSVNRRDGKPKEFARTVTLVPTTTKKIGSYFSSYDVFTSKGLHIGTVSREQVGQKFVARTANKQFIREERSFRLAVHMVILIKTL